MNKKLFKQLLTSQLHILFTTVFAGLNIIIDQVFTRRISKDHFDVELAVAYAPIFYILVSRVLGQTLLFNNSKTTNAMQIYFVFCAVVFTVLSQLGTTFLDAMHVRGIAGSYEYYLIYLVLGSLLGLNLMLKYVRVAKGQTKGLYHGEIFANLLNVAGNAIALKFFVAPENQLLGIGFASLIAQGCAFLFLKRNSGDIFKDLMLKETWTETRQFFFETKKVWSWDLVLNVFHVVAPLTATFLLTRSFFSDMKVGFNVALGLLFILERPFVCLNMVTAPLLQKEDTDQLRRTVMQLAWVWTIPVLLFLLSAPVSMSLLYQLEASVIWLTVVFLLSVFLHPVFCFAQVRLRALQQTKLLTLIEIFSSDLFAILLFLGFAPFVSQHLLLMLAALCLVKTVKLSLLVCERKLM